MDAEKRIRLDKLLTERGHYGSRSRARDAINRQCVQVDGVTVSKPGGLTSRDCTISIDDAASPYVSRAALKLLHGLEISSYQPDAKICLDIGASTGGFSQVLLERGAAQVFALDVGHDQLEDVVKHDPRVVELSGINSRNLEAAHLNGQSPAFLVCDVSFISLKLALPRALDLAEDGAKGLFLIKPQFEVGRECIGKGGIVCDVETGLSAAQAIRDWLDGFNGWRTTHFAPSPITGGDGNLEYLVAAEKQHG